MLFRSALGGSKHSFVRKRCEIHRYTKQRGQYITAKCYKLVSKASMKKIHIHIQKKYKFINRHAVQLAPKVMLKAVLVRRCKAFKTGQRRQRHLRTMRLGSAGKPNPKCCLKPGSVDPKLVKRGNQKPRGKRSITTHHQRKSGNACPAQHRRTSCGARRCTTQ